MYKYQDFVLESRLDHLEFLSQTLNEGLGSFSDEIQKFLDKEFQLDTTRFEESVKKLLQRFKGKSKILSIITGILLSGYMGADKINTLMSQAGVPPQEQVEATDVPPEWEEGEMPTGEETEHIPIHTQTGDIKKFLGALADSESSGNPKIVNRLGYIGKYQFGKKALEDLGLEDKITTRKFIKNPHIFPEHAQDKAMLKLLKLNKSYLGDYIERFNGKVMNGVKITKSGLLAGAHLVGAGAVKKFLDSGGRFVPKDGNNVPVTDYIKKFAHYQIDL